MTAQLIHRKRTHHGRGVVIALGVDAHGVRCIPEDQLDRWFVGLDAERKADIYVDAILLQPESACRFCGCTDSRACPGGCLWIDEKRTVCSATPCFRSYLQEVAQKRSENAQLMQHFIETGEYPGLSVKEKPNATL